MEISSNWHQAPGFTNVLKKTTISGTPWYSKYFTASQVNSCERKIWYQMMLYDNPSLKKEWGLKDTYEKTIVEEMTLDIGNAIHKRLQSHFVKLGWCQQQDIETTFKDNVKRIKGKADAIIRVDKYIDFCKAFGINITNQQGTHFIVEIKTKKQSAFDFIHKPDVDNYGQLQYLIENIPKYNPRYSIVNGMLLYINKDNSEPKGVAIKKDIEFINRLEEKRERIVSAVINKIPMGRTMEKESFECSGWQGQYACEFLQHCWS